MNNNINFLVKELNNKKVSYFLNNMLENYKDSEIYKHLTYLKENNLKMTTNELKNDKKKVWN